MSEIRSLDKYRRPACASFKRAILWKPLTLPLLSSRSQLSQFKMSDCEVKDAAHQTNVNSSSQKVGSISKEINGDDIVDTALPFTEEEERRVKWKTDLVILPLLCAVFFLQYLDKQSLSYASVFGLIKDLKLRGTQYSWCSSIFYVGELIWKSYFRNRRSKV